jgi:protoporphyrinogen/coproporphyrinogen III oxidase
MNRRKFLEVIALSGAASSWVVPVRNSYAQTTIGAPSHIPPARLVDVDHFEHTHALRDATIKSAPPEPDESVDVVIVGGGLSGLVSAYRLRGRNTIVLEKEFEAGGNSRFGEVAGCRFAQGAFLSQGPIAPFTDFFKEIGAEFIALARNQHELFVAGQRIADPLGKGAENLPWSAADKRTLRKALERLNQFADAKSGIFFPFEQNTTEIRALDSRTMWDDYAQQKLPQNIRGLFDTFISARIADSGENLSAWYGNYLLSSLLADSYTMRGGHGALSQKMVKLIQAHRPNSVRTGVTVFSVKSRGTSEVWVSSIDASGRAKTISAKSVVLACPKHFAKYVCPEIRQEKEPAISQFKYNGYLVAQLLLKKQIKAPYELMAPELQTAKFLVSPDALAGNQRLDGGGLLTVYVPYPRTLGRARLLAPDVRNLAALILSDVGKVIPEVPRLTEEIMLHRWGHPMLTAPPRFGTSLEIANKSVGRIALAHGDNLGITGLYSAVWAGMQAENDVELILTA